jgi:HPt (histidine-containing phosphotransfer) domain-containing protein
MTSLKDHQRDAALLPLDAFADRDIIDVCEGVERVMGDRALYTRMLTRFRSDYKHGIEPIRGALARGDQVLAHRLAHTLKGSSGMIGAHVLHQHACALERVLLALSAPHAELDELADEFTKVHAVLDGLFEHAADPAPAAPPRVLLADTALLAQLDQLLANGDGAAIDLLEESGTSLRVILGDARLEQLLAAANAFDFDAALDTIKQFGSDGPASATGC